MCLYLIYWLIVDIGAVYLLVDSEIFGYYE